MSNSAEIRPKLENSTTTKVAWLALFAAVAVFMKYNSGVVDEVEAIRVPADAIRLGPENNLSQSFVVNKNEVDSIFCGKVVLRFMLDHNSSKSVENLGNGTSLVECDTEGYDIPVLRIEDK